MASDYQVVSAGSEAGEALKIPIGWEVSNPATDFRVYVVPPSGVPELCDYWAWDAAAGELNIPNALGYESWSAYVSRDEKAAMLAAFSATGEVDVFAIIAQLAKNVRVLEQLQEADLSALRSPDKFLGLIPTASVRKGKVLAFDDNGNPVAEVESEDVANIKKYASDSQKAAESAKKNGKLAQEASKNAQAQAEKAQKAAEDLGIILDDAETSLEDIIETAAGKAIQDAKDAATAAASDKDAAIAAKNDSVAAANASAGSASAAEQAQTGAASFASSASVLAQQTAQDKNAVAEMKTSVEGTKTQIDASAQQVAQDRAAAEIAAGTAVNASDLAALSRRAANVGFFEFDGGKITGSMAFPNFPFSICTTVCAKTMPSGFQVLFQSSVPAGISVSLFLTPEKLIMDIRDGGNGTRYQYIPTDFTRKLHTIVWVARSLTDAANVDWTLYIDGLPVAISAISTLFSSDDVSGVRPYGVNSSNDADTGGAASTNAITSARLRLFNFDMSAEGAPYSVADYAAGIDPSPSLMQGTQTGACLALSDAADSSQIRDESGNGNHALISGAVLASKKNNPAHCSQIITWAGTSTLQNVCGNAAIPANSKVTAYAKSTGAVTASFKASSNTAQSKELATNTLTEIGSWLCGAVGAFSVQPSAAYTGSIETYLIIERL